MNKKKRSYPVLYIALLAIATTGCPATPTPEYGVSGFDALGGVGQRLTDTMLKQATNRGSHPSQRIDNKSPIQMTDFVNMNDTNSGDRFGTIVAEHIAQRLVEKGYLVTRSTPPDRLLQTTFFESAKPTEHNDKNNQIGHPYPSQD